MNNQLIPVESRPVGSEFIPTVNARELHSFLGNKDHFATWVKDRVAQFDFIENKDFVTYSVNSEKGRPSVEYALTLDMAKELCMVERNEKGKQARQYFIECERQAKSKALDPMTALNDPATMRTLLLQYAEKNIEMQPKALAFDMLMSSKNSMTMGEAAKALGWGRNMLFSILRNDNILMSNNVPYQKYIDLDYFRVRTVTVEIGDHTEMKSQTLVTAKGLNWLAQNNVEHMQARKALLARKAA
jgi:anti-repressor protein